MCDNKSEYILSHSHCFIEICTKSYILINLILLLKTYEIYDTLQYV